MYVCIYVCMYVCMLMHSGRMDYARAMRRVFGFTNMTAGAHSGCILANVCMYACMHVCMYVLYLCLCVCVSNLQNLFICI